MREVMEAMTTVATDTGTTADTKEPVTASSVMVKELTTSTRENMVGLDFTQFTLITIMVMAAVEVVVVMVAVDTEAAAVEVVATEAVTEVVVEEVVDTEVVTEAVVEVVAVVVTEVEAEVVTVDSAALLVVTDMRSTEVTPITDLLPNLLSSNLVTWLTLKTFMLLNMLICTRCL